jgi:hypothetical protein
MRVAVTSGSPRADHFHRYSFSFVLSHVEAIDDLDVLVQTLRADLQHHGKHIEIRIIGKNPIIPPEIYMAVIIGIAKEVGSAATKAILSMVKSKVARFRKQNAAVVKRKSKTTDAAPSSKKRQKLVKKIAVDLSSTSIRTKESQNRLQRGRKRK